MVRKGIFSRWGAKMALGAENHRKWLATGLEWPKPVGRPRRERKMAREWLWQAHLREFAFICGPFWAIGGIQMAEKSGFLPQMDANGRPGTARKGNFGRKTGNIHENRRGTGLNPVFLCFLFFCLGCGVGWLSGYGGLSQPTLPDGKEGDPIVASNAEAIRLPA